MLEFVLTGSVLICLDDWKSLRLDKLGRLKLVWFGRHAAEIENVKLVPEGKCKNRESDL